MKTGALQATNYPSAPLQVCECLLWILNAGKSGCSLRVICSSVKQSLAICLDAFSIVGMPKNKVLTQTASACQGSNATGLLREGLQPCGAARLEGPAPAGKPKHAPRQPMACCCLPDHQDICPDLPVQHKDWPLTRSPDAAPKPKATSCRGIVSAA